MGKSFSPFMHHFNSIPSFRISLGSLILRRPRLFAEGTTNNDLGRLRIRLITWLLRMIAASSGLSLRAGGRGFSPATKRVVPGYFYWKIEEK